MITELSCENLLKQCQLPQDKHASKELLLRTRNLLDAHGIQCFLAFGTLLGAIRDNDFCTGDTDVDIGIFEKDEDKLVMACSDLERFGLRLIRTNDEFLISFSFPELGHYIDVYVFRQRRRRLVCWQYWIASWRFYKEKKYIQFMGRDWLVPARTESYLDRVYGNWHVPENRHAMS